MPLFKDRSGQLWEYDNPDDATRQGMVQASDSDIDAHNKAVDLESAPGLLESAGRGVQAGLGHIQDIARETGWMPPVAGSEAFGPGAIPSPALDQAPLQAPAPPAGAETFPGGFDDQARAAREAHPIAFGAGQGLASAPFAAIAGGAAGAVGGPALLGASLLGVATEAGVEGAFQEYSDAYFEQRPFELKNVAANTLMFSGLDFAFRGALKGIGSALTGKPTATKGALGGRNVVSEAQGAARELVDPVGGSVGAARAADLEEPFVDAIAQMSDKDAAVLARDADDHLYLISQDASEAFTRLNNGLSDDLGSQLKYEDIGTYAQEWEPATIAKQDAWWGGVSDQATLGIEALKQSTYELGNLGKRAADTLDTFWRRVTDEVDPGQRMVTIDAFKKRLDKLSKTIDASDIDDVAREELKAAIVPTRETLRKGLENKKLFGGAADLQRSLNSPWHGLLEHWGNVQKALTEVTGTKFDVSGAGRITRESTVDRMRAMLSLDNRSRQEFTKHLAGTLENIQGLIDARQAYGIARKDGLDALGADIRNMMEDWNLASTVSVARKRVDDLKKDPRKWGAIALDLAERIVPMAGAPIRVGRGLSDAFTDLHISQKSPLGRVWNTAYQRYAGNTALQDPAILHNYSPWVQDALKSRGGKFMPPAPPAGAVGSPAIPGMPPANANAHRSVAQPQLSPAAQGALARSQARAQQGGSVTVGATAGNPVRPDFSDPKVFYAETPASKKVSTDALSEDENDFLNAWQQNDKWFKSNERAADYEVPEWVDDLKARGVPESTLKKLEVQDPTEGGKSPLYRFSNGGELGPDGTWVADDSSVTYQPGVVAGDFGNQVFVFPEVRRASVLDNSQREAIIPRGEKFRVVDTYKDGARTVHVMAQEGSGPAMAEPKRASAPSKRRKRAGERGFVEAGDGPNFSVGDVATSPMGLVTGAGGVALGANALMQEPEPPPAQPPEHAYRDALREIEQAGQSQVRALASDALRAKPRGKDRDPLSLFAGKRKLQDAVEETRERLDEIAADPSTLLQQLGDSAGDLGKTHPSVYMAMTEKAAQVAAYLQAVIPARTATTLLDPVGAAPSFDRAWDYAARFVGATQPRVALREAIRGGAPPEMLEAVQETWPELWSAFQVETLGQIQRMHAAGRHIPSEKLRRLDSLLGLGGQLDPSASLEVTQHMLAAQDAELAKRQEAGQATGAMPSSGPAAASFRTRLAAISAERQMSP